MQIRDIEDEISKANIARPLEVKIKGGEILQFLKMEFKHCYFHNKRIVNKLNYLEDSEWIEDDLMDVVRMRGVVKRAKSVRRNNVPIHKEKTDFSIEDPLLCGLALTQKHSRVEPLISENAFGLYNKFLTIEENLWHG
jgi:hypothetical protein